VPGAHIGLSLVYLEVIRRERAGGLPPAL
jgi:hypothetical protein